jgi:hypothetical protein
VQGGHDPNKPSAFKGGRTPLAELCAVAPLYAQRSSTQILEEDLISTIKVLKDCGAHTDIRIPNDSSGRSLLHLALDSADPCTMTKAFLESGEFHSVSKDFNLFTDGKYTYSPTMYVQCGPCKSNKEYHAELVTLLKCYRAQDRYWKNLVNQPDNMINPPDNIKEEHLERVAEQKRRDKIREEADFRAKIEEEEYENQADLQRRRHTDQLELQNREYKMNKYQEEDRNTRTFNHVKSMSQLELDTSHKKNKLQLAFQDDIYSRRQRQQRLEESGRKNAIEDERRLIEAKIELGRETRRVAKAERAHQEWRSNTGQARITNYAHDDDSDGY